LNEVKSGAGIVAARSFPDFAALIPGYAFERSCKNRLLANLFRNFCSIFGFGRIVYLSCSAPMFHGNKAAASTTYKDPASPIQRPHLTIVAASF
jgi:hypothetical protein